MQDIGFNLKYVREDNPFASKIADLQFKQLVREMDKSHNSFMKTMSEDPSVDYEQLKNHYGKNYTE